MKQNKNIAGHRTTSSLYDYFAPQSKQSKLFPKGIVDTVQLPHATFEEFLSGNSGEHTVMMKLFHAKRLVNQYEDPKAVLEPHHKTITSSAMDDKELKKWSWEREIKTIREFKPDFHLPTDYSIYKNMSDRKQREVIDNCMEGTEYATKKLHNINTQIIPFAKGWKRWHFRRCAKTFERLGFTSCAFYASGYENRITKLEKHVKRLIAEIQPENVLIIGPQTERYLRRFPPEVVAAAGTRWRKKSKTANGRLSQKMYEEWKIGPENALGTGQHILGSFKTNAITEANS